MNIRRRAPLAGALIAATLLTGCGIFKGGGEKGPKTAVLGERIPVLTVESSAGTDASIAANPVIVPPADTNTDWTQPAGNAQKAMGNVALGAQPVRVWDANIGKAGKNERLAAAPVIADGHLFVMDTQARVHAYDAQSGRELWETQLKAKVGPRLKQAGVMGLVGMKETKHYSRSLFGGGVSYEGGKLYATSGLGDVAQLDAASGKLGWQVTPGGPLRGAPSIANGAIYVMSADNQIYALSETDGSTQWTASGPLETAGVFGTGAPAIARATVIAGFSSGDLDAYRYENGRIVWQDALTRTSMSTSVGDVTDVDASPVVDESRVYAVGAGGRMIALDLTTGQRLWEVNLGGISTPALGGDWLFVVADDAKLYCIERTTGKIRWTTQLDHWRNAKKKNGLIFWNGPVIAGGRLVLTNSLGEIAYVTVADGKVQDSDRVAKAPFTLPPVVANNMMYLLSSDGRLTAWR
ncbi:PQQ-binding-like beta-propeller repeat protein [Sphingomonas sp. CGMCC 1.13654]|uniref:PQQ-binding-like beta-propeller repeat protein n=1 Tax=Sphingomonas chungangi TaxID=2683589 RepID=A0A838L387_9SPHN|nr:PQQ-like beta-propeller repeat protein [Sphingomonas chungangi]MBA2933390.1 PQQ-binding-like beta-propeller repeat protein [Sphingomonas chungangi]MVW54724.1 PQQ-binding-like beta-propeller repeat protein [Sphingomonas chungangi]